MLLLLHLEGSMQTALKRATSPVEPEFDRSKNLMIFGLPEAENEDDASTRRRVTKVFTHLECYPVITSDDINISRGEKGGDAASTYQGHF